MAERAGRRPRRDARSKAHLTARGRTALAAIAAASLVAATVLVMAATRVDSAPGTRTGSSSPPVWDVRRAPALATELAARDVLGRRLDAVLAGTESCVIVSDGSEEITARDADRSLVPASTQKLLTGAATLAVLGDDATLDTAVLASGDDLYLVGGGDPTLGTAQYRAFLEGRDRYRGYPVTQLEVLADDVADALAQRGTPGDGVRIHADDSRHESTRYLPSWKPSYRADGESGPLGALVVNGGFTQVGGAVGADDPALAAAQQLADALRARGVVVESVDRRVAPADASPVARLSSAPARQLVAAALRSSDNLSAELLAREVGRSRLGEGTTEAGTRSIEEAIAALGVPTDGVDLVDGSGLSPDNRATCSAIASALDLGATPGFEALDEGLAVAGESGTLAGRLAGHPLSGVLRAKTGQIAGVAGLAGHVDTARAPTFAIIANGSFSQAEGNALQVAVAEQIAEFPAVPSDTIGPPAQPDA